MMRHLSRSLAAPPPGPRHPSIALSISPSLSSLPAPSSLLPLRFVSQGPRPRRSAQPQYSPRRSPYYYCTTAPRPRRRGRAEHIYVCYKQSSLRMRARARGGRPAAAAADAGRRPTRQHHISHRNLQASKARERPSGRPSVQRPTRYQRRRRRHHQEE